MLRISFDIDDTIVCYDPAVPVEPSRVPWWRRRWYTEPLRLGTPDLMRELLSMGCRICFYTTSYRTTHYMKRWLRFYGVRIENVINQSAHEKWMRKQGWRYGPSKYPPAFGIDLHVDDLDGVEQEGRKHGFEVVVVRPHDEQWAERVLGAVRARLR